MAAGRRRARSSLSARGLPPGNGVGPPVGGGAGGPAWGGDPGGGGAAEADARRPVGGRLDGDRRHRVGVGGGANSARRRATDVGAVAGKNAAPRHASASTAARGEGGGGGRGGESCLRGAPSAQPALSNENEEALKPSLEDDILDSPPAGHGEQPPQQGCLAWRKGWFDLDKTAPIS